MNNQLRYVATNPRTIHTSKLGNTVTHYDVVGYQDDRVLNTHPDSIWVITPELGDAAGCIRVHSDGTHFVELYNKGFAYCNNMEEALDCFH